MSVSFLRETPAADNERHLVNAKFLLPSRLQSRGHRHFVRKFISRNVEAEVKPEAKPKVVRIYHFYRYLILDTVPLGA